MARWTSMTMEELKLRYRAGALKGRMSWPQYLRLTLRQAGSIWLAGLMLRAILDYSRGTITHVKARELLVSSVVMLILTQVAELFPLREGEEKREQVVTMSVIAVVSATIVLLLTAPRL